MYKRPEAPRAEHYLGKLQKTMATYWKGLAVCDYHGQQYTFGEAAVKAVKAGSDLVLVCHDYGHAEEAYMGLLNAVKEGNISEKRLDESVRRILKAKLRHGMKPVQ